MEKLNVVISSSDIKKRIKEISGTINNDFGDKKLVVVGILNGAFIFLADIVRCITVPHEIDFIRVSSYGDAKKSSGAIRLTKDVELDVRDKHVLLVEDIVDTGTTMAWLVDHFSTKQAASVSICSLIDKLERRESNITVDYHGFVVEQSFLVGYGLDFAEKYRYLPEICSLEA